MKTNEQRIKMMHELAFKKKRKAEEVLIKALGVVSIFMLAMLLGCIYLFDGKLHPVADAGFSGNSMLSADAGGYILVAVISFIVAVVITILCIRYKEKNKNVMDDKENPDKT